MEPLRNRRNEVPCPLNMKNIEQFYSPASLTEKRISEATDFYDTELDDSVSESTTRRSSLESYKHDGSNTTISTPELPSSEKLGKGTFNTQRMPPRVEGPKGPHLFRDSITSSRYSKYSAEVDIYFQDTPTFSQLPTGHSDCFRLSPGPSKNSGTGQPNAPQIEKSEVRSWEPSQVAHWLSVTGFDSSVANNFEMNDISGFVLFSLQMSDLKEIGIKSFGKRYELMKSIENLRETVNKPASPVSKEPTISSPGSSKIEPYRSGASSAEEYLPRKAYGELGDKLAAEEPVSIGPTAQPPEPAQSDCLGPAKTPKALSKEALREVEQADPQDNIRRFLDHSADYDMYAAPESAPPMMVSSARPREDPVSNSPFQACQPSTHANLSLYSLPRLRVPESPTENEEWSTVQQFNEEDGSPTPVQKHGPFSHQMKGSFEDSYRQESPFSEMDVPVIFVPNDSSEREASYSVPPGMQYRNMYQLQQYSTTPEAAPSYGARSLHGTSSQPGHRIRQFELSREPQISHQESGPSSSSLTSDFEIAKTGWMKKRKPARFLRHDWQDAHFTLKGTSLAMHKDEREAVRESKALENIDVDQYAVACTSTASNSKLSSAFKRSLLRGNPNAGRGKDDSAFAFSLVPSGKNNEKKVLFPGGKSHHFAVNTRDERVDWMRDLMLAKALKRGKENGGEMRINGNAI